ncbi:MAG: AAA family ATPase [Rhizobiaceae bacterium]
MNADIRTSWDIPTDFADQFKTNNGKNPEQEGRGEAELTRAMDLVRKVADIGNRERWTKSHVADLTGMPIGTFSQWVSGKYPGRYDKQNDKAENWLDGLANTQAIELAIPTSPKFIQTKAAGEIFAAMSSAQILPSISLITMDAGMGKTMAAENYIETHANCWLVTISPSTRTIHGMLLEIARSVNVQQLNAGQLVDGIGRRVRKQSAPTLLIVDEAQNLIDDAINQLRHFCDVYKCGIALLGNDESYTRFSAWGASGKYGQLKRRIFKRVTQRIPHNSDLAALIAAWGISDEKMVNFLMAIGKKAGAMGQIDMTVKLAKFMAMGNDRELGLKDLQAAWKNRDVEV